MASDLPNKKSCSAIGILALTYNCILKDVRVKPQNRTEASPTTTECSTTELRVRPQNRTVLSPTTMEYFTAKLVLPLLRF
jgi:hypothetical protein